ncbi:MAG: type IV toxin-antitoxin system AbiEi family antitoxin [Jiangellaceae bacterium]
MNAAIAEAVSAQLSALGVKVTVDLETVKLVRGRSAQSYTLICGPTVTLARPAVGPDGRPPLVFTTFVAPKTADSFRRAGVQYADTAGNAWVEFGDVLLDVRGRPRPKQTPRRARATGNLLSTSRAQVVFALLAWPELWHAPQRELAHAAGVSLGQAHNTLALLAEAGYHRNQTNPGRTDLLDLWAAAYPTGLAQRLTLANYHGKVDPVRPVPGAALFVSGESAAINLLRPASVTVHVDDLDPRLPVVNRWRSDGEPNIVVRKKFWRAPGLSEAPAVHQAPWPLVYADLLASDDPRVRGVAKDWKAQHARADQRS